MSTVMQKVSGFFNVKQALRSWLLPGEPSPHSTEVGYRPTPENSMMYAMRLLMPSFTLRAKILDIRKMDEMDPRVKKIHERTARAACKGGLKLEISPTAKRHLALWEEFKRNLGLNRRDKLESDLRGALMEGNLPIQWVLDTEQKNVVQGVRMPTETLRPVVGANGQFLNPMAAYEQWDFVTGKKIATFPLWQLSIVRVRPDNYDDWGSLGRPYLDASRESWRKLNMTETDLVIRRHTRAAQRMSHVLDGASDAEIIAYEKKLANDQNSVVTDYVQNKKGGATAVPGDANLDQIADVMYLLDTFMSGAPAPKGLFGYVGDLARDVLEDLKREWYDEVDALQDMVSLVYELGFRLNLLLHGINPDEEVFSVVFEQRRTDTPNQLADLALKYQAMLVPAPLVWQTAGLDPAEVLKWWAEVKNSRDPYPMPNLIAQPGEPAAPGAPKVSVTPGNARKGESGTSISH